MKPETFFDNFEVLAESPNGVKKLREMILELAVRGKLVAQDEKDEPARVLLEKIKAEKEWLIKEKKIKKAELQLPVKIEDMIYGIPNSWKWSKFNEISSYIQRGKSPDYIDKSNFPVISQKCVQWDGFNIEKARFISASSVEKYDEERFLRTGDILWNSTGTGTVGRANIYKQESNSYKKIVVDSHVTIVRPIMVNPNYVYLWIASPSVQKEIENKTSGSTKQVELATSTIRNHIIPIPPLEEQHRIVAKVDQLMSLCDELEARQQKKRETRAHLNSAALDRLLAARAPEEFAQGWRRISDNFDLLYDAPENVGALRQAILQLAVMGKLVAQDERDEPATILLEKIKAEKERLVKDKKITKAKALPKIHDNKIPYNLPEGWKWSRLGDICHDWGQKKPDVEFTYIDVSSIDKERGVISDNIKILKPNEAPSRARKIVYKGTVIYATVRPYLLNIAIVDKEIKPEPIVSTAFAVLYPLSGVLNRYLYYYLRSKSFITYVESEMIGMAYPAINDGKLYLGLVPLPPLNEQHRIVARVDQLMSLCDKLEAGLRRAQADSEKLMEAVVGKTLAGGDSA